MIPAQSTWQVLEDQLVAIVTDATASGGVLGVQANPDGTTGVQLVERNAPPEQNVFPSVGIMAVGSEDRASASNAHDILNTFTIILSVRVAFSATQPDTGAAALTLLREYQNDAQGNGLEPLLRTNVTLGGLCSWSYLKRMERYVLKTEAEASDAIATAIYTFETMSANVRIF